MRPRSPGRAPDTPSLRPASHRPGSRPRRRGGATWGRRLSRRARTSRIAAARSAGAADAATAPRSPSRTSRSSVVIPATTTSGVPPLTASQNLFGVVSRWFADTGGSGIRQTSADAVHDTISSGGRASSVRWRPAKRGSRSRARLSAIPRPNPSRTRAASGTSRIASAAFSRPRSGPRRPWNRTIRVDAGRPVAARMRSGGEATSAGSAGSGMFGTTVISRPGSRSRSRLGERLVDRRRSRRPSRAQRGVGPGDPGPDPGRHRGHRVRLGGEVDHVVDDAARPPGRPDRMAPPGVERGRDRQRPAGVVEVRGRQLVPERRPPAADGVRPEQPAPEVEQRPGERPDRAPHPRRRPRPDRRTARGLARPEHGPRAARPVAAELDRAGLARRRFRRAGRPRATGLDRLALRQPVRGDGRDLDRVALGAQGPGDPERARVRRRRAADEDDRARSDAGRRRRRRTTWCGRCLGHHGRPVSRPYSARRTSTWASQLYVAWAAASARSR